MPPWDQFTNRALMFFHSRNFDRIIFNLKNYLNDLTSTPPISYQRKLIHFIQGIDPILTKSSISALNALKDI